MTVTELAVRGSNIAVVVFVVDGKVSEGVLASPFRETPQRSATEAPA